jgi:glycosyltransferase involved in cell wall biosynthesis
MRCIGMKVLQIACGVSYTKVYKNLFLALKQNDTEFEVYIPQHNDNSVNSIAKDEFPFTFYSNKVIKSYDKFLYYTKIKRMTKDVETNFNLTQISLIHSHSLFTDGAVAYDIYKKYHIPYVVAIRDTDVNQYFHKAIHLRKYGINILRGARNIIFLSKTYRDYVLKKYVPVKYHDEIINKTRIIPNGIDNYWLSNKYISNSRTNRREIRIVFVGQIIKRKNVLKIVEASNLLEKKYNKKVNLVLIGERKDVSYFNDISRKGTFKYIPYLSKEELISYYRKADVFVMPSITETFGLVYAEAMSQGLPVIYSLGQGFDGQFKEGEVGYGVNPQSAQDIADKINLIVANKEGMKHNCLTNVDKFNWSLIGKKYKDLYYEMSNHI